MFSFELKIASPVSLLLINLTDPLLEKVLQASVLIRSSKQFKHVGQLISKPSKKTFIYDLRDV